MQTRIRLRRVSCVAVDAGCSARRQSASGVGVPAGWLDFGRGGVRDERVASEAGLLKSVLKLVAWPLDTSHLVATVKMAWG